jgi:hypothetical protein
MSNSAGRRWCIFTSAGDRNAIRLWTESADARRWDLVVVYYGDDDDAFAALAARADHVIRDKGSKFQNLRKHALREPGVFDRYSHVWVCDDDIVMTPAQIDEAFAIAERFDFWVAQPAFSAAGKISYWFTYCAGPPWDFHLVNFVEENTPIFRRDKLMAFLSVYDGVHPAFGIDYWYMTVLNHDTAGKFAIIDRVQVINPADTAKGGVREIESVAAESARRASFYALQRNGFIARIEQKILGYGRITSLADGTAAITTGARVSPSELQSIIDRIAARGSGEARAVADRLVAFDEKMRWRIAVRLAQGVIKLEDEPLNRLTRTAPPQACFLQYRAAAPLPDAKFREIGAATAVTIGAEFVPVIGAAYDDARVLVEVRVEIFGVGANLPRSPAVNRQQRRAALRRHKDAAPNAGRGDRR